MCVYKYEYIYIYIYTDDIDENVGELVELPPHDENNEYIITMNVIRGCSSTEWMKGKGIHNYVYMDVYVCIYMTYIYIYVCIY
jgi:hypothetical protein